MIWIRADANREIGSGHVMRCLSIAAALKLRGEEVCFLVADESAGVFLEQRGVDYKILGTAYDRMEEELELITGLLVKEKPDWLLIDSYFVTQRYLMQLRPYVKTAYLDEFLAFSYPVDVVINYNIYGVCLPYREQAAHGQQVFLLGTEYAPLREQFKDADYTVRKKVEHVLVTTGGSDKYNLAGLILEEVLGHPGVGKLQYHVVSGALNVNYHALEELAQVHENVRLYQNISDMAGLMKQCDIAIAAGGSTMYELSAVGVPTLCFAFVDNQEKIVDTFYQKGYVVYGGNYIKEKENFAANVAASLEELAGSEEMRRQFSEKMRRLVDGQGADRIAEALLQMYRSEQL